MRLLFLGTGFLVLFAGGAATIVVPRRRAAARLAAERASKPPPPTAKAGLPEAGLVVEPDVDDRVSTLSGRRDYVRGIGDGRPKGIQQLAIR